MHPHQPDCGCLGIDPGLRFTGWGLIEVTGNRLRHLADGVLATDAAEAVPARLRLLHDGLAALIALHRPDEAAVEQTYVNRNGEATLKLGYARGVALLAPALAGIPVAEYGAKSVKLSVVGTGGADKNQVMEMVRRLAAGGYAQACRCGGRVGGGDMPCASQGEPGGLCAGGAVKGWGRRAIQTPCRL